MAGFPPELRGGRAPAAGRRLDPLQPGVRAGEQRPAAAAAVATLGDSARFGSSPTSRRHRPRRRSHGRGRYKKVVAETAALRKERISGGATVAFTIPEKEVAPEGVAYDPVTKAFFVASVRKGKIVRIGPDGKITDFIPAGTGPASSALGIGDRSEAPHALGRQRDHPADERREAREIRRKRPLRVRLDSGRLRREHAPPESPNPPHFDDLRWPPTGASTSTTAERRASTTSTPAGRLAVFLESDAIGRGTQGLAATPDGRALYASDYRGLYRIDVATKRSRRCRCRPTSALNGVDGLVFSRTPRRDPERHRAAPDPAPRARARRRRRSRAPASSR